MNTLQKGNKKTVVKDNQKFMEGRSLFMFSVSNPFRRYLYQTVNWYVFEYIVIAFIIISAIVQAVDQPLADPNGIMERSLVKLNYFVTFVFFFEMVIKIIAQGFYFCGKDSYLRDPWNVNDFVIVVTLVFDIFFGSQVGVLSLFKMLRTLRPLKIITKNEGLKIAVSSLGRSLGDIGNALIISFFFFLIFAIFFVNYFKGKLF